MEARIQKTHREDNSFSPLVMSIVLTPRGDTYWAIVETLERAGFVIRVWENREIIVYSTDKDVANG